jgi:LysR family hydrogen peroxide-inducible transcriptional activator
MMPPAHSGGGVVGGGAMEMHQIRYFLAVSDTLNFTRAAERCNVTQPALTRAIQKLEEEFGGLLFRRERHHSHLTDLGRLIRPQLEQVWQDATVAKSTAKSFLKLEDAALTVGLMCTIGPIRGIGFLNEFRTRQPGVDLTLLEGVPDRLAELLHDGEIDVAVMAQPARFEERLDIHPLYREHFTIAFPPGHRFESVNAVRYRDIHGETYLRRLNCEYWDALCDQSAELGVEVRVAYRSEREDWIQTMVMAGMGICFLPEYSVLIPGLLTRRVIEPEVVREVCLVTVAGRRFSPAVAKFVAAIRSYPWAT